jgi:Lar family restriction alleviation protein
MACGFPYCAGVDCKDCHKPRCNAIEYCDQWPSCSPACPLTSPNAGIKPCPFCGCPDTGLAQMPLRKGWLTVQCSRCEASGPWRTEEDAAIASWNGRLWQRDELLRVARLIEDMKQECGMDPESPTAIRNGRLMSIAAILREQATGGRNG